MPEPRGLMDREHPSGWLSPDVAGVVLAGGRNSRMGGADKAFLRTNGRAVIERTLDVLGTCFPQTVVVSNCPQKYASYDVIVVTDEFPGFGPLAGIHAAMGAVDTPYVFVVACDMPFVQRDAIAFLVDRLADQDALIPCWESDIEPLHGIYAVRMRDRIEQALARGVTAIRDFLPSMAAELVPENLMRAVPGAAESFCNVNTLEDAARFRLHPGMHG